MSKFVEKSVSVLLALVLLFSVLAINTSAAEVDEDYGVMPCWTTISRITTSFSISRINSTSTVILYSQVSTSLKITINLQKVKSGTYQTIETWTKSGTGVRLVLEETRLINVLSDYRIKVTCKAGSETNTTYAYP